MIRRPVAAATAFVLFLEAVGVVLVHYVLGRVVDGQSMSLAGTDPGTTAVGAWVLGGLTGLFLVACGAFLLVAALRDRAPARIARILLIVCAVAHGVLGTAAVGLVGWWAFGWTMAVLGLIVLCLLLYGQRDPDGAAVHAPPEPTGSDGPLGPAGPPGPTGPTDSAAPPRTDGPAASRRAEGPAAPFRTDGPAPSGPVGAAGAGLRPTSP
ncbi:hypothetical protein ACQPZG_13240 [Streptomyces sp. CA-294286]|uniref:hypothetical protein n=1 Tax=Streptomyces sp. CA-294286 TaxID=3240070 RepID=UPI003D92F205